MRSETDPQVLVPATAKGGPVNPYAYALIVIMGAMVVAGFLLWLFAVWMKVLEAVLRRAEQDEEKEK